MINKAFDEEVFRVAAETIEALALMFLLPEEEAAGDSGPRRAASVGFDGPFEGSVVVSISECLLPELAGNMLGQEDSIQSSAGQQEDALKELTNVICGNILPVIGGREPVFHVGTPIIVEEGQAGEVFDGQALTGKANMFLDEGTIQVFLYADETACVAERS